MADDLDDEWWKEDEEEDEKEMAVDSKDNDDSTDVSEKKKKKKKKKNITEQLAKTGEIMACKQDLTRFLEKQFDGKLSQVERDEITIDEDKQLFETNSFGGFTSAYLKQILPKWKKLKSQTLKTGSPILLVITSSALRAVQLNREIQNFKGADCKCAKLFAKHMKLEEQEKFLKKAVCHLGVGTPNRIQALLKRGPLQLESLSACVIDWNWRDMKKRRLVDIPEVRSELAVLLQKFIIPHINLHSTCKIGIL